MSGALRRSPGDAPRGRHGPLEPAKRDHEADSLEQAAGDAEGDDLGVRAHAGLAGSQLDDGRLAGRAVLAVENAAERGLELRARLRGVLRLVE